VIKTAAEKTATNVETIALGNSILSIDTVTSTATDDWFVMSNMEATKTAIAFTSIDGTNQEAYVTGSDQKVYLDVAGAATVLTIGTSVKSTGGST